MEDNLMSTFFFDHPVHLQLVNCEKNIFYQLWISLSKISIRLVFAFEIQLAKIQIIDYRGQLKVV